MMALPDDSALDGCKRLIYRRIQLAAALFVIRSTPEGKSAQAHAAGIQQRLRTFWLNRQPCSRSPADQYILAQQQDILSSRLCALLPPSAAGDALTDHGSSRNEDQIQLTSRVNFDSLKENGSKLKANANFILTVTQLKALAEAHTCIPRESYFKTVSKLCKNQEIISPLNENEKESFGPNCGDGFVGSASSGNFAPVTSVASSVLLYIINSFNGNELVEKSIQGILNHLTTIACTNDTRWSVLNLEETINQWAGSVYEQAERALKSAIGINVLPADILNHSHNLCESFLRGIVLYIIKNKAVKEIGYTTKENQIVMVLKILGGPELWLPSLQLIFSCLLEQAELIRSKHLHKTETIPTDLQKRKLLVIQSQNFFQDLEDSVFLFQLLRKFLTVANRNLVSIEDKKEHIDSNCEQKASRTIANLWRKHHQATVPSHSRPEKAAAKGNRIKFHFRDWKQSLEGHFGFIMYQYPLIATVVCECFQCLPTLDH